LGGEWASGTDRPRNIFQRKHVLRPVTKFKLREGREMWRENRRARRGNARCNVPKRHGPPQKLPARKKGGLKTAQQGVGRCKGGQIGGKKEKGKGPVHGRIQEGPRQVAADVIS